MEIVCFWFAVLVLLASVIAAGYLHTRANKSRQMLSPLNILFAGVLVTAVLLFLPAYWLDQAGDVFQPLKAFLLSLYSAIRLFAFDSDYDMIPELITGDIAPLYTAFATVVVVLAPLLTFSFVLSFFGELVSYGRVLLGYFAPVYVFSELNDRSLALAADIHREKPKAVLVFTDVFEPSEDIAYEQQERAQDLGAVLFQKDVLSVDFGFHDPKAPLWFFAIAQDEDSNINHGLRLIELYGSRKHPNVYVFSTGVECEALLSSAQNGEMKVRRIDEVRSLINRVLYDEGHLLFDPNLPEMNGEKVITAVIVGMGKHGKAMMKALTWFCQMYGYRPEIHGFDMDELAEESFAAQCPELMDVRFNGTTIPGEAHYRIEIHSGVQVKTRTFAQQIKALTNTSYVLVALGDDGLNIRTAMNLRMLFEQCGAKPRIQAIVYNSGKCAALQGLKNFKNQPFDIDFIGDLETSYTERVIIDSELEEDALRRHLRWGHESEFWSYEYNYSSSIAAAIHARAKQRQNVPGANKTADELTEEEQLILEDLEHRRWNAYMRSEGYIYSGSPTKASRNDLGKMHQDLIPYDDLDEGTKRVDSQVASK